MPRGQCCDNTARRSKAVDRFIGLFESRHPARPGEHHDTRVTEWQVEIPRQGANGADGQSAGDTR